MANYEVKFVVIKIEDSLKYLTKDEQFDMNRLLNNINKGRVLDNKKLNDYYVVNTDEKYSQEVFNIIMKGEDEKNV